MTERLQYQALAEPINQAAENVRVDKWKPEIPDPVRTSPFKVAVFAASLFFLDIASVEAVTVDKWYQPASEPVRVEERLNDYTQYAIDPVVLTQSENILVTEWYKQPSEPVQVKKRLHDYTQYTIDPLQLVAIEATALDKWYKPLEEPVRTNPRSSVYGEFEKHTEPIVEVDVTLDKWFREIIPAPLPIFQPYYYPSESFRVDTVLIAEPIDWRKQSLASGDWLKQSLITDIEVVTLDKWYQAISEPAITTPRSSVYGEYVKHTEPI